MIYRVVKISFIIFLGISSYSSFAIENYKVDSLERELFITEDPKQKMGILIEYIKLVIPTDIDKALKYAIQTESLAIKYNDQEYKMKAWLQLSIIYRKTSDYRSSIEVGYKAKALAEELDMDKDYAMALLFLAISYSELGDYKKSADYFFQALGIMEELGDKKQVASAYNGIGSNYFHQNNLDKAGEYYKLALKSARESKDLAGISRGLNNVAIVYLAKQDYKSAEANLQESIEINKILDRPSWEGINYLNLGNAYRLEKIFDTSILYLNKAYTIIKNMDNYTNLSGVYFNKSMYYSDIENIDSSLHYAKLSYNLGKKYKLKLSIYKAAYQLRYSYHLQNNIDSAFKYLLIEKQIDDSLSNEKIITRISQLELLHEFEKNEQENKIKQQRLAYIYIASGVVAVSIFIILVIIIFTRIRFERRRFNLKLETKNRELAANVMTLIRKNEILSDIGEKLMEVQDKAVKIETKTAIKKIAHDLQQTTGTEVWDEFEVRFKLIHGEFYDKLIKQFPKLSPNELKLCAFLRLNMTTKEISELTGQEAIAIERARTRLRKKIGLAHNKINLITFLSKL